MDARKSERASVVRWRRDRLAAAGFTLPLADRIARDRRWDLHQVIDLVERGCAPELAVRISAPLEPVEVA